MAEILQEILDADSGLGSGMVAVFWKCRTCGQKIDQQHPGIVLFELESNGPDVAGPFFVVHKMGGNCQEPWLVPHRKWQDLDDFMWELSRNSGVDWAEYERRRGQDADDWGLKSHP